MYRGRKLIFLDIDGVLNPQTNIWYRKQKGEPISSYNITLPGDKLYRLKRIIRDTGAEIIISSSWRIGFQKELMEPSPAIINLQNQLARFDLHISGYTPLHNDRHRGREIANYLMTFIHKNRYKPKYVIIDNEIKDLVDMHQGHIVHTNSMLGLQDEHVHIAISILNS